MDYKSTLNLPKTDFPMKAELAKREPELLSDWLKQDIYKLIRKKYKGGEKYILHDGPPYANADIHIGHALNKTLKDIVVKYKTMKGLDCAFVPGWDCHGLPVEHQLFKELGIKKYQIGQLDFRKKAYRFAIKFVDIQKEEFKRLGVFGDWDNPYLTLDFQYEEAILRSFSELCKKGFIYHGLKPVNWCYVCETALAEAEVEYENHVSPSIYVKFKIENEKTSQSLDFARGRRENESTYLLIWTTTPWTLIANVAVAVHPDFIYCYVATGKGNLIIAKDLLKKVTSEIGLENSKVIKEIKGSDLEGLEYSHPFGLRKGKVVCADYVAGEEGTGLVHTAPGHGNEDYLTGLKYNLEIIMPVDSKGNFDSSVLDFKGINVFEANKAIIEKLKGQDLLLFDSVIEHSYPHCWRCKSPVIFRATKQWFLKIDHMDLRKKVLNAIRKDIKWIPESGRERIYSMVEIRPDWCLSRQRYWGVPIPAVICKRCKTEILEPKIIDKFAEFALGEGTDSWFIRDINDFLPSDFKCPDCKNVQFSKGTDILDVWFDSGVSHQAVLKNREDLGKGIPCALYLEGSDQHRGWFQSSLIPSVCIDGIPPFKTVLTHGFVVDGLGRKMSKSQGNVISPQDIIKDYGADILRLWVASSDYNEDIRISNLILTRLSEAYRKIRNTLRFILSNLYDFQPNRNKIKYEEFKRIDKWILFRLQNLIEIVSEYYENFYFYKAYKEIYDFCNVDLSMYYLDMIKGRLYTYAADSLERRCAQTVAFEILDCLIRLIAPILVFTAEEAYRHSPLRKQKADYSVHLLCWPKVNRIFRQHNIAKKENIESELKLVIDLLPEISKSLEVERLKGDIGSSFDAQIILLTNDDFHYKYLRSLKEDLPEIFKVSQINIIRENKIDRAVRSISNAKISYIVKKAEGNKCTRCWNYSLSVGNSEINPLICDRCIEALKEE